MDCTFPAERLSTILFCLCRKVLNKYSANLIASTQTLSCYASYYGVGPNPKMLGAPIGASNFGMLGMFGFGMFGMFGMFILGKFTGTSNFGIDGIFGTTCGGGGGVGICDTNS